MTVIELKQQIEEKKLSDDFLILQYSDESFIAFQYVDAISKFKNKEIILTDLLKEDTSDIFGSADEFLYVVRVDKFSQEVNPEIMKNRIVICKTIDTKVKKIYNDYIISIPKLTQWHKIDYAKTHLTGLSDEQITWLVETVKDIYRLSNEIDKIKIFNEKDQPSMLRLLDEENNFGDLNSNTVFEFTNAVIQRDVSTVSRIMKTIETLDIEPMGVVSILYNAIKNVLNIQLNPKATAESLNMSSKQFYVIERYNTKKYADGKLLEIFDVITSIDERLKKGKLDYDKIIDYLLIRIL